MRAVRWVLILGLAATAGLPSLVADPVDDLASPSQATRDAAAKLVRASYRPIPRERWEPLLARIQPGISKDGVLWRLRDCAHVEEGVSIAGGGGYNRNYRLDDQWVLRCDYAEDRDRVLEMQPPAHSVVSSFGAAHGWGKGTDKLFACELYRSLRDVWVEPSRGFTGIWVTYTANGQKSHQREYANGAVVGDDISYYQDGRPCVVQHHDPLDDTHIEETDYYPSGRVSQQGEYRGANHQSFISGTWTQYNEDGSLKSRRTYPAR